MHKIPHKIPHATFSRFTRISLHADLTRISLHADIFTRTFLRGHFYADIPAEKCVGEIARLPPRPPKMPRAIPHQISGTFLRGHFLRGHSRGSHADIFTRTFPRISRGHFCADIFTRTFLRGHFYADIFTRTFLRGHSRTRTKSQVCRYGPIRS